MASGTCCAIARVRCTMQRASWCCIPLPQQTLKGSYTTRCCTVERELRPLHNGLCGCASRRPKASSAACLYFKAASALKSFDKNYVLSWHLALKSLRKIFLRPLHNGLSGCASRRPQASSAACLYFKAASALKSFDKNYVFSWHLALKSLRETF